MSVYLYARTIPHRTATPKRTIPVVLDPQRPPVALTRDALRSLPDTAELDGLTDEMLRERIEQAFAKAAPSEDPPPPADTDTSEDEEPEPPAETPTSRYVSGVLALLPSEVILLHSAILALVVTTEPVAGGLSVKANSLILGVAFFALLIGSSLLYVAGRFQSGEWDHRWDYLRMCIPPVAFVAWSLLEPATALDHILPDSVGADWQGMLGLILAAAIVAVASAVAYRVAEPTNENDTDGADAPGDEAS